jgi:hypothetical protein
MTVTVDPFLNKFETKWVDSEGNITSETRHYMEYLERHLLDMWRRTGGPTDSISDEGIKELYPWQPAKPEKNAIELTQSFGSQVLPESFEIVVVTADYTTTGRQIVVCNNTTAINITLNTSAEDLEEVHVIRQNSGAVNVSGPALGGTTMSIGNRYSSPHFTYIKELLTWVVI